MSNLWGEEPTPANIGLTDAVVRFVLGPTLIGLGSWGVAAMSADWVVTMIHPVILGVYLVLTAAIRTDLVYLAVGIDTLHEADGTTERVRAGKPV